MLDLVRVVCSKILRDCATAGCGEYLRGVLTGSTFLRGVLRGVLTGSGSTYGEYYGEYLRGVCMVRTAAHVRYYFNMPRAISIPRGPSSPAAQRFDQKAREKATFRQKTKSRVLMDPAALSDAVSHRLLRSAPLYFILYTSQVSPYGPARSPSYRRCPQKGGADACKSAGRAPGRPIPATPPTR